MMLEDRRVEREVIKEEDAEDEGWMGGEAEEEETMVERAGDPPGAAVCKTRFNFGAWTDSKTSVVTKEGGRVNPNLANAAGRKG